MHPGFRALRFDVSHWDNGVDDLRALKFFFSRTNDLSADKSDVHNTVP